MEGMTAGSRTLPSAGSLIGATAVAGTIAFFFGASDASTPVAVAVAGAGGLFTGMLLYRPARHARPDGRLAFRTPEQLGAARDRLIQARKTHTDSLKEREGVRRRLADLLARMREVGLSAYSTRIATIERGLATLDRQVAVLAKLRDGYDRSIRMIDIELEAGRAAELLDEDIGSAIGAAMYELRLLEESQADLARQLEANDEVEGLMGR